MVNKAFTRPLRSLLDDNYLKFTDICQCGTDKPNSVGQRMHIPVAREEVAQFLETCPMFVDELWRAGRLQRTIGCPYRCNPSLNWSSQYDVLEYALASGDLPVKLTKEEAALWICNLAEVDESGRLEVHSLEGHVSALISMASEDGLSFDVETSARIATTIFVSRHALNTLCLETDLSAA